MRTTEVTVYAVKRLALVTAVFVFTLFHQVVDFGTVYRSRVNGL